MTSGLEDGARIEPDGDGWVVVDRFRSYLTDPEDASWVVDLDDKVTPLAVFPTAEAAYWAWEHSEQAAKARNVRLPPTTPFLLQLPPQLATFRYSVRRLAKLTVLRILLV